jgi:hypothetical protein
VLACTTGKGCRLDGADGPLGTCIRSREDLRLGCCCRILYSMALRSCQMMVSVQQSTSCLALVVVVAVAAMGCGGGEEVDPRELTYCGGTCYMACCADSHDTCPDLMPLQGSPCEEFFGACGYGCREGSYYGAFCSPRGEWTIIRYVCMDPPPWDAGMTPDATDPPDATGDEDGGEGDAAVDAAVDADGN